jgi:hypothetical protein
MKYKVDDNATGKSYIFEGNTPPTETDIDQYLGKQTVAPVTQQPTDSSGGLGNIPIVGPMIRNLTNYAQDVGTGLGSKGSVTAAESAADQANKLLKRAATEKDPTKKLDLYKMAGDVGQTGSNISQQVLSSYSPDINQNYIQRGFTTGANIASIADLVNLITGSPEAFGLPSSPNIVQRGSSLIQSVKGLDPYKSLPARMENLVAKASESGDIIKTDDFIDAFKNNVKELYDPNAKQLADGTWRWADPNIEDYVNGVESYIKSGVSGDIEGVKYLDAQKLFNLRKYFANQLPQSIFQKAMMGRTPQTNVFDAARWISSQAVKGITPGLASTDTLYSLLRSVLGPNELSALERIGIGGVGIPAIYKLLFGLGGNTGSSFSAGTTSMP